MLNFRRVKQDFSSNLLKQGKDLFDDQIILDAKLVSLNNQRMKLLASVKGPYENTYDCELEIDRLESEIVDSNCDCPHSFDCQHLAALLFYLETHIDRMIVEFSKINEVAHEDESLKHAIEKAKSKHDAIESENLEKELLDEYMRASNILSNSLFFTPEKKIQEEKAQIGIIIVDDLDSKKKKEHVQLQLSLRLAFRTKPLIISEPISFFRAIKQKEVQSIQDRAFFFTLDSFDEKAKPLVEFLLRSALFENSKNPRNLQLNLDDFGEFLAICFDSAMHSNSTLLSEEAQTISLPFLFYGNMESPMSFFSSRVDLLFQLEYMQPPTNKLLVSPKILCSGKTLNLTEVLLLNGAHPGLIFEGTYYRFSEKIKKGHLDSLDDIASMAIPQPLFGTFVENSLPEMIRFAKIVQNEALDHFVTLPFTSELKGRCKITYIDAEMDAEVWFIYEDIEVPASNNQLKPETLKLFETKQGIVARSLIEEKQIIDELFQGFYFDEESGKYVAKTEKKIVEFMTQSLPKFKEKIHFECPENLLDQFRYDHTTFALALDVSQEVGTFSLELKIKGDLDGLKLDLLWDCIASKKKFIELNSAKKKEKVAKGKFLVLDLDRLSPIVQLLDEIGITDLKNQQSNRPLWNLIHLMEDRFENIDIEYSMSAALKKIQSQILGKEVIETSAIPQTIRADLRNYQLEGVAWLERLCKMHLSGILADDMGLGKTLQAICAIALAAQSDPKAKFLIICPTSLTYNWMEEFQKFCPSLKVQVIDGPPNKRVQVLQKAKDKQVFVTSYTLLQKDIDKYEKQSFYYAILDEAQHIKNRGTRNAKSVKRLKAQNRLILTGTPIENSLEDLWSLFDFLMPAFLGTFDRFIDRYVRSSEYLKTNLDNLRRKIFPFILRRMKQEVLKDLPPISHIVYHCQLTSVQQELYVSYAKSAKEELSKLVQKEGFDKIRIHVLATLTRLKQICCHPAIFAKDQIQRGDSAKYEMLLEMLPGFAANERKTVVFSQYTKMLEIMKKDLIDMQIPFVYLDGSSKNRLEIVKQFNEDPSIFVFLVSLKAGGVGLNLTSADSVIHYDMWWNPAVENQATDRVHRLGQKKKVSSYKLITAGTIEEKIQQMQDSKRGLVKKLINTDEEVISKLTWEEVLELLKT